MQDVYFSEGFLLLLNIHQILLRIYSLVPDKRNPPPTPPLINFRKSHPPRTLFGPVYQIWGISVSVASHIQKYTINEG